ncbi:MAG: 30S ribosomal protein S15 [Patescibacteria group bacterium]|nr:30S ribosomal protein S15 [Patescibacteria group bacterium]
MALKADKKQKIIGEHRSHEKDTGSVEVQIALLTVKIDDLTKHLKKHKGDMHSRQGLFKMVGNRRRLLNYLEKQDLKSYNKLIKKLKIRK